VNFAGHIKADNAILRFRFYSAKLKTLGAMQFASENFLPENTVPLFYEID